MHSREERELNPADLRGILKYVPQWRNHVFVLALDGAVLDDDSFMNLMLQIAVLRNLNIDVVLVHGIGAQLARIADSRQVDISDQRGYGSVDAETLELAIEASGRVAQYIVQGLTQHGIKCASCNAVRSTYVGVIEGQEQGFRGKVEKIDIELLQHLIRAEIVPVLSPIAVTREGQSLRLNSDLLASRLALALKASKLIYLMPSPGLTIDGEFRLNVDVAEVKGILSQQPERLDAEVRSKATFAVETIEGGTPRAHLIDSRIHDGLLTEIFSKVGIGSMIHSNPYQRIRKARLRDVPAILSLTRQGMRDASLKQRRRSDVERDLGHYFIYEIDDSVIACAALQSMAGADDAVELASVFVQRAYTGRQIGRTLTEYAEEQARAAGKLRLFALTTQSENFFLRAGFARVSDQQLPEARRQEWIKSGRNSHVLLKILQAPAG